MPINHIVCLYLLMIIISTILRFEVFGIFVNLVFIVVFFLIGLALEKHSPSQFGKVL